MRSTIILLLSLFTVPIKAQTNIFNLSLTDTTQNIFYIGVENIVRISGENFDSSKRKLAFLGGGGTIFKKSTGIYTVRVKYQTDDAHIWITENNRPVFKKNFRVRNLDFPLVVNLGGLRNTTISIDRLLSDGTMQASIPDCLYKTNFLVVHYKAIFIHGKDSTITTNDKSKLSSKQIELAKRLVPGDKIYFNDIVATSADFRSIKCLPFEIIIE